MGGGSSDSKQPMFKHSNGLRRIQLLRGSCHMCRDTLHCSHLPLGVHIFYANEEPGPLRESGVGRQHMPKQHQGLMPPVPLLACFAAFRRLEFDVPGP